MRQLLVALLVLSTACIAEEPENGGGGGALGPDAGMPDAIPEEDRGVQLQVEGLPPQTYWNTVPVFGRGPANGTLLVESNEGTVSVELSPDGSFCMDVPLEKGALNLLEMVAIDELGERSDAQSFDVSQSGEPPEAGDPVAAKNVLLGALPVAGHTIEAQVGEFGAMTDSNLDSSVRIQNAITTTDWFILRVPSPDGVESIKVYSNTECLMGDYSVYTAPSVLTNMLHPGTLDEASPWTMRGQFKAAGASVNVTDCSEGAYACQEYQFDANVTGAIGIEFNGGECSNFWGLGEHQVQEIQAWSPEGVAPPSITAPSCQGGL
jgi:hypothetical protein